jgi:hypothetical protein
MFLWRNVHLILLNHKVVDVGLWNIHIPIFYTQTIILIFITQQYKLEVLTSFLSLLHLYIIILLKKLKKKKS